MSMGVSKILTNFATSKPGKAIYQWAAKPGTDKLLNQFLPTAETIFSTACYIVSTQSQKNIDKDQKNLLQIQNVASGIIGVGLGTMANKWVSKKADAIIKDLDPTKIEAKALRQASAGIRILLPIATTALLLRCVIPTVTSCFSGKVMDKIRAKRGNSKVEENKDRTLNIKA